MTRRVGRSRLTMIVGGAAAALVITAGAPVPAVAAEDLVITESANTTAEVSGQSARRPYVVGLAQVAKGYPIRRGRVMAENLKGERLDVHWGHHRRLRHTQKTGAFTLPAHGLPLRFVVVVRGGTIHGRKTKGTFRSVVTRSVRRGVVQMSLGTTVQTSLYRTMRGKRSFSAQVLRKAHNRTLRTVQLPRYLTLGWDDRVNPRFIRGKRLQKYANELGGYRALARHVERAALKHRTIPLSSVGARTADVAAADVVDDCADATFDFTPKALAECVASGALAVVSSAFGPSPSTQVIQDLQEVTTDLADLSTQLSSLQADVNADFLDLMAQSAQNEYNAAARELLPVTSAIQAQLLQLSQVASNVPGTAPPVVVNQQLTALVGQLDPDSVGSVLSSTTATELADGTVADGASGLGTLPAAWQAIRDQQQTGSLGATVNGDAALGQGTTLFTNEMSTAFQSPSEYWFNQLQLLGILTANYYNYLYAQDGLTPSQVVAQTADVIGGFSASGTCPGSTDDPSPVACPGSISYNLMQQVAATPMTVPPGTVVDPTTNLVWGTALGDGVPGSTSGSGLPDDPASGNSLVPELLSQVHAGASTPWPGVNTNLLAVSQVEGVQDWNLPEVNFATGGSNDYSPYMPTGAWPYSAGASPQLGNPGSGSGGLLGGLSSSADLGDLSGLTDPPAFPNDVAMWSQSNLWSYIDSYWNGQQRCWNDPNGHAGTYCDGPFGGLPSGAVQFGDMGNQCGAAVPDLPIPAWGGPIGPCPSSAQQPVSAAVVLNATIPSQYYAYPAQYPESLLSDPGELVQQISLFR